MNGLFASIKKRWQRIFTAAIVLTVFTVPASKGILAKLCTVDPIDKLQPKDRNRNVDVVAGEHGQ